MTIWPSRRAVHAAQAGHRQLLVRCLLLTMLLGLVFLGIKGYEYWEKYHDSLVPGVRFSYASPQAREAELFLILYFVMTGLHALHMLIGLDLLDARPYQGGEPSIPAVRCQPSAMTSLPESLAWNMRRCTYGRKGAVTYRPRVVIVGGGFGGLYAAKSFRGVPVDVTLIDKENYHLFLPLLYQVAIAGLSPGNIAAPLREVFSKAKNIRTLMGEVTALDVENRWVIYSGGKLPYDALIIATGSDYHYFGNDQWRPYAPSMDGLQSALEMRRRLLSAYEQAEQEPDPAQRQALMTFVIVGGGPTGVELAGAIAEMARHTLKDDFRIANPRQTRVILIELLDRVLPPFPPGLSEQARQSLTKLGVTVRTGTKVVEITDTQVIVESQEGTQEHIPCYTAMWAAGVKASGLSRVLHERTGVELDRAGRVHVAPDLSIHNYPEIFVVGDMARMEHEGRPLPGLAPVAMQQGVHAAQQIQRRLLEGQPTQPFHYADRGTMATIGRAAAVADLRGIHLSGFTAWLIWLFVHLMYLVGFRNRLLVFVQWIWNYFTYRRGVRLIVDYGEQGRHGRVT